MVRLFILYAILIFAKKAPKLISDLLNLNKDGESVGLKGLNIKNKMGEAALVGDKVKKGMMGIEGGIKKTAGIGRELARRKLKAALNPVKGKVKGVFGAMKGGFLGKDGEKGGFKAAMRAGHEKAKKTLWDPEARKENAKEVGKQLKANTGKDLKQIAGGFITGFDQYKDKENTKGSYVKGRKIANPNYQTVGERISGAYSSGVDRVRKWAGLDDDKEMSNRQDRTILGMNNEGDAGKQKIKIDKEFADEFPTVVKLDKDGNYQIDAAGLDKFVKGEGEARDRSNYQDWSREKQLTFDKYTQGQVNQDLNMYRQCLEQMSQLTQSLANAQQYNLEYDKQAQKERDRISSENKGLSAAEVESAVANAMKRLNPKIDTSELERQQSALIETMNSIASSGYEYNGAQIDITNIDNALNKSNEDYSKTCTELKDLKTPKSDKDSGK